MTTERTISARNTPVKRADDGMPCCRWCGKKLAHKQLRYCPAPSPEEPRDCLHQWKLRSDTGYMRQCVLERDKGVCAICGCDTLKIRRILNRLSKEWYYDPRTQWEAAPRAWLWYSKHLGLSAHRAFSGDLWDADHIIPVVEGGGRCGLENIRTLCVGCHKDVTRELRGRLKRKKGKQQPLLLPLNEAEQHSPRMTFEVRGCE